MNNAGVVLRGPSSRSRYQTGSGRSASTYSASCTADQFLPHMMRGSGYIINTASIAGLVALTGEGALYIASKFAIVGLSEALALYARPKGIGVSVLCPGSVDTNLDETERVIGMTRKRRGRGRAFGGISYSMLMTPDQIGAIVVDAVQQNQFFIMLTTRNKPVILKRAGHERFPRSALWPASVCQSEVQVEVSPIHVTPV